MSSAIDAFSAFSVPGRIGYVLAAVLALYMAFNTLRALAQPAKFAAYLGSPLHDPRDTGFVLVYAFRAAFLALFVGALVVLGDIRALRLLALVGIIMPLGDAWLTSRQGGGVSFALRHLAVAAVLILTWFLLGQQAQVA